MISSKKYNQNLVDCMETPEYIFNSYILGREVHPSQEEKYKKIEKDFNDFYSDRTCLIGMLNEETVNCKLFKSEFLLIEIYNKVKEERMIFLLGEGLDRRVINHGGKFSAFIKYFEQALPNSEEEKQINEKILSVKNFGLKKRDEYDRIIKNNITEKDYDKRDILMYLADRKYKCKQKFNVGRLIAIRLPTKPYEQHYCTDFEHTKYMVEAKFINKLQMLIKADYSPLIDLLNHCPLCISKTLMNFEVLYKSIFHSSCQSRSSRLDRKTYSLAGTVSLYPGKFSERVRAYEINFEANKFSASEICYLLKNFCQIKKHNLPEKFYKYIKKLKFIKDCFCDNRKDRLGFLLKSRTLFSNNSFSYMLAPTSNFNNDSESHSIVSSL